MDGLGTILTANIWERVGSWLFLCGWAQTYFSTSVLNSLHFHPPVLHLLNTTQAADQVLMPVEFR